MEEIIDEFIINSVREIQFIYDKKRKEYKDTHKKREAFHKIAENISKIYYFDSSAERVQKRWEVLKDRYVREHKKNKNLKSGSGASEKLMWTFYTSLSFLDPFISHRQTKSSYSNNKSTLNTDIAMPRCITMPRTSEMAKPIAISSCITACEETSNQTPDNFTCEEIFDDVLDSTENDHDYTTEYDNPVQTPVSNPSFTPSICKAKTKSDSVPEWDNFAKRKKKSDMILENQFLSSSRDISNAVKNITIAMEKKEHRLTDQYLPAIEESLSRVPQENRTACLIEILGVIQKYEKN